MTVASGISAADVASYRYSTRMASFGEIEPPGSRKSESLTVAWSNASPQSLYSMPKVGVVEMCLTCGLTLEVRRAQRHWPARRMMNK